MYFSLVSFLIDKRFAEDQQAIEDEGIIIPMKPNMPHVPFNNPYNRNSNNFFQQQPQQPPAFARALPLYHPASNPQLAMMNYYNAPNHQQALNMEQENIYVNLNQPQPKQQIPIDVVSDLKFLKRNRLSSITFPQDLSQTKLSKLSCEDFINLLTQVNELKPAIDKMAPLLRENAITGRVLLYCELNELKSVSWKFHHESTLIKIFYAIFRCWA